MAHVGQERLFQFRLFRQFAGAYQFFFLVFDLLNVYQKSGDDGILFIYSATRCI